MSKVSKRLGLGEVVGQVVGGLIVGPIFLLYLEHVFPVYHEALSSLHFLSFVFLSIIAFGIGDELNFEKLRRLGSDAFIICIIQALATGALIAVVFVLMGFELIPSLIIGCIGIATAPASSFVIMNRLGIGGKMRSMLGGLVVMDDAIEVVFFSIMTQVALAFQRNQEFSFVSILSHVSVELLLAIALGLGVFIMLRSIITRKWLRAKNESGFVLGPEFLSRLISEMSGPSMNVLFVVWGSVSVGIALALHWHLPFLLTAVAAGVLVSNFYSPQVFNSLKIENATAMFTLIFFALIGANADLEAFRIENLPFILAYILARSAGKLGGTWLGCKITKQERRLSNCLPKLMLPQAGVAAIEAFFVSAILGESGKMILSIVLPSLLFFEVVGILLSERTLMKWRSWETGGGELLDEEEKVRKKLNEEQVNVYDLIRKDCLRIPLNVSSKGEAIWELIEILKSAGFVRNPGEVLEIILERERQGGITLGEGVAILHGRIPYIEHSAVALGILGREHGINFGEVEDSQVDIVYMVLSPTSSPEEHLKVLASIARFLSDKDMRTRLRYAKDENDAMHIMKGSK